jgi:hypothetical protein
MASSKKVVPPEEIRANCPKCGPNRVAQIMASYEEHDGDGEVDWWNDYRIIRCPACTNIQLQIAHTFSEDYDYDESPGSEGGIVLNESYTYWPPLAQRQKPDWFNTIEGHDSLLGSILTEAYRALDNEMPISAATTMRTAFDRVTELLKIDPTLSFKDKLQSLVANGELSLRDKEVLEPLIEAGNAAAHRAWSPNPSELTTMILILEALVHRAFILSKQAKALSKRTPKRKKKL